MAKGTESSDSSTNGELRSRRSFIFSDVPGALGAMFTGARWLNAGLAATFLTAIATQKYHEYEFALDFLQNRHDQERISKVGYYNEVVQEMTKFLEKELGMELKLNFGWRDEELKASSLNGPIALDRLRDMLIVLVNELNKYPPGFIRGKSLLRMHGSLMPVYFINEMTAKICLGRPQIIAGLAGVRQRKGISESAFLALNAGDDYEYMASVIHHELNHSLFFSMPDTEFNQYYNAWLNLHQGLPGFIGKEEPIYDNSCGSTRHLVSNRSPFLSLYAQSSLAEDMAVWAEALMIKETHREIIAILNGPQNQYTKILKDKYRLTKEAYRKWSGGSMDDAFWRKLLAS